jgi:uncharacterized repeat protein (TIGR01451 family)/fimbrial isopeptide formation D2 family protein
MPRSRLQLEVCEDRILCSAAPNVSLSGAQTVLLPKADVPAANFTATFANAGTTPGFGPYVDLALNTKGIDGAVNPPNDGITFQNATYLGQPVQATVLTFDANGQVQHPFAKGPDGKPLIIKASDFGSQFGPGDSLVVLTLPFGSFEPEQPSATVNISLGLSNLADVGAPLDIAAKGGFEFGNDALNNPTTDPTIVQSTPATTSLTPELFTTQKTFSGPEDETATGPNYIRQYTIAVDVADGQTITNLDITDQLPSDIQFVKLDSVTGGSLVPGTNVNPSTTTPGGTLSRTLASVTGGPGSTDATVTFDFYVPRVDANDNAILNPQTGDSTAITNDATVTGQWLPLDPRDQGPGGTPITINPASTDQTFTAKSITAQKSALVIDNDGQPATTIMPGDTIQFTVTVDASDYFAFQNLNLTDTLPDGLRFDSSFTPVLAFSGQGATINQRFSPINYTVSQNFTGATTQLPVFVLNPGPNDGTSALTFRISNELLTDGSTGKFIGGGIPDGGTGSGALPNNPPLPFGPTTLTVTYRAIVQDQYSDNFPPGAPEVVPGDSFSNKAAINGSLLNVTDVTTPTGSNQSDDTHTSGTVSQPSFTKTVYAVNGSTNLLPLLGPDGEPDVRPGDTVTYRLQLTLPTGDVDNLTLTDYLPLPVFDTSTFTVAYVDPLTGAPTSAAPASGEAKRGPLDTFGQQSGIVPTVTEMAGNAVKFDFGSYSNVTNNPLVVDLLFTATVSTQPLSDGMFVTDLAQSQQTNSKGQIVTDQEIAGITVQEPAVVSINKGVVGFTKNGIPGTGLTLDGVTFTAPGTPSSFTGGPIFSSDQGAAIGASDLLSGQVDGGDSVRMAIVAQNTGSGDAFNIQLGDAIPAGYVVPATLAGLNLSVRRGDGTLLTLGTDYTATFDPTTGKIGISLIDDNVAGNVGEDTQPGALSRGLDAQTGAAITNGSNSVVITYDLVVATSAQTGSTITNTASLTNYANTPGGPNFLPTPITDPASITLPEPTVTKVLTGTESSGTGNNAADQAVIGELLNYTITLNVPEGTTAGTQLVDILDPGLAFVDIQSVTLSPGVTTANTVGTGTAPANVSVTNSGSTVTFNFGNIVNADTDNTTVQTITIVYQAVVLNTNTVPSSPGNQAGTQLNDRVELDAEFTDSPGGVPTPYTVAQTGTTEPVTVVEPNLTLTKGVGYSPTGAFAASINNAEAGETVFYQISITNSNGNPTAFNSTLSDPLPTAFFQSDSILSVTGGGLTTADFVITDGTLQTVNPVDIAAGTTINIVIQAQIINSAADGQEIDNKATLDWTSLPGSPGERSIYNAASTERTGADGPGPDGTVLNNYADTFTSKVFIATPGIDKRFGGGTLTEDDTSVPTAGTNPLGDVVVGESIIYDGVINLPQGVAQNLVVSDLLPLGLRLDPTFNNGKGYEIITTAAGSGGELKEDFSDPLQVLNPILNPGGNGANATLSFGNVSVTADGDSANNAFVIRVRAIVTNVVSNQTGTTLINGIQATFTNPNTGATTTLRDPTPGDDAVTVVEPDITVTKTVDSTNHDAGDPVTYTVTLSNIYKPAAPDGSQADAYDLNVNDPLPAALLAPSFLGFTATGFTGAFTAPTAADFEIVNVGGNNVFQLRPGVTLNMPLGSSISFQIKGTLATTVDPNEQIPNSVQVSWTSTPGTNPDERTGTGLPNPVLPTPDPAVLNNYAVAGQAVISVPAGTIQKGLVTTSEPSTQGSDLTIGETATYGLVVTLPEGTVPDLSIMDQLSVANQQFVSFQVVTTAADSQGLLTADFGGTLNAPVVTGGGALDSTEKFDFGQALVNNDNDPTNNSFVIFVTTRIRDNSSVSGLTSPGQTVPVDQAFLQTSPSQPQIPSEAVSLLVVEPQIQITKSITPDSADAGDPVTVTINLQNTGTSNAFDVIVTDALPPGAFNGFAEVSGPADFTFTSSTNSVTFSGGTIAVGQSVSLVYSAVLTDAVEPNEVLTDTATVTQDTTLPGVQTGERNEPPVSASSTLTVPLPQISKNLVSTSDPNIPAPDVTLGDTVTYGIVVTLPEGTTPNLTISDIFDPGMRVVPNSVHVITSAAGSDGLLTSDFEGTVATPTITGSGTSGAPGVINFGQITVNSDNDPNNNSFLILVTVQVLDDPKTQGIPTAANGFQQSILPNTATLTAPFDPTISVVSNTVNVTAVEPNLVVTKSVDDPDPDIGQTINFSLTIRHTLQSTAIAYDVIARDTLPSGLQLDLSSINVTGATLFSNDSAGNEVNLHLTDLPLGAVATVTFSATVLPAAASIPAPIDNNARIYWDTLAAQNTNTVLTPGATDDSQARDYGATPGYIEAANNPNPDDPAQDTIGITPVHDAIQGKVYQDADTSGTFAPGDRPIPGVQLTLTGTTAFGQPITLSTTTNLIGNYAFSDLAPGTYVITETQPARFVDGLETPGNPGSLFGGIVSPALNSNTIAQIVVPSDANVTEPNYNFGELLPASIAGSVYLDDNNDGVREPGEEGIPAIPITLTGTDVFGQSVSAPVADTGALGNYQFSNLRPGTYSLVENDSSVVPALFLDGKDTPGSRGGVVGGVAPKFDQIEDISLPQATAATGYNFGELRPASLAGTVYNDSNGDGTLEPGEPGISGVTLTLTGTDDLGAAVNRTTTTDANGNYRFLSLRPGSYTITETQPPLVFDGDETIGSAGGVQLINDQITRIPLNPGTAGTGYNFAELPGSVIQGSVYQDNNNNGLLDPGEAGIQGVTVTLTGTNSQGTVVDLVRSTNARGIFRFVGLLPGTYTVSETQPAAFLDGKEHVGSLGGTLSANDVISNIPLLTRQRGTDYDFGELLPASISGSVYYDANDSGTRDPGEAGIAGTGIKLTGTDDLGGQVSLTATTDANGNYTLTGLRPGTYTVTETQPAGFLEGEDTVGSAGGQELVKDQITNIPISPGVAASGYNFGEFKPSSIAGIVYLDRNDDAAIEPGEPEIAGVTIRLTGNDRNGNPVSLATTTDTNGRFVFTDLLPGNYQVNEVQPAGYFDGKETIGTAGGVFVANDQIGKIGLAPGTNATGYLFGERLNSDLVITKDDQLTQVVPGQAITYQITIRNQGPQDAEAVIVTDQFPTAELDFVSASNGGKFDPQSGLITWNLGRIANSNQQVVTLTVSAMVKSAVPANSESVTNSVSTVDKAAPGPDPTPQNNLASDTDVLLANPDLFVTKTDNRSTIEAGQADTYMITVGNRGDEGASGVIVRDTIPNGTTFVSASNGGQFVNGEVVWNLGTVPVGAKIELTVTVNVSINGTVDTLLNVVTVADSSNNADDPTPQNNLAVDTTVINRFAYDTFQNFATFNPFALHFPPSEITPLSVPRLAFTFSGEADPGATLAIEIIGPDGARVGYAAVVTDIGGNWIATIEDAPRDIDLYNVRISVLPASYGLNEPANQNFRAYFAPALLPQTFYRPSEALLPSQQEPLLDLSAFGNVINLGPTKFQDEILATEAQVIGLP